MESYIWDLDGTLLDQGIKLDTIRLSIGTEKEDYLIAAPMTVFEAVKQFIRRNSLNDRGAVLSAPLSPIQYGIALLQRLAA